MINILGTVQHVLFYKHQTLLSRTSRSETGIGEWIGIPNSIKIERMWFHGGNTKNYSTKKNLVKFNVNCSREMSTDKIWNKNKIVEGMQSTIN